MVKTTATIQCTNAQCGQAIPFDKTVCAECLTPVTKRYLHTLGTKLDFAQGELIGDRYICVSPQVVVDTKPREIPVLPSEVADRFLPYLKLFSCRNHIPQLYGQIALPMTVSKTKIWLAELGSFSHQEQERIWQDGQLLIPLLQAWGNASNLSKLNWLWQWARLWIPFQRQGVCSSLTDINLMGISSSLFKLVELNLDQAMVTLADLGETWQQLLPHSGQLSPLLQELCDRLISKSIVNPEYLVALLEGAMQSAAQGLQRDYRLYTLTDAGPTRDHNEDACFPEPGNLKLIPGDEGVPLAIVCDGIGGHEGGEVASGKSIKALSTTIPNIGMAADTWNSNHIRQQIDNFVCEANDEINGINDAELREDRKRMGTTLVMAVAYGHEMYLTHVGDSRIYFISSQGAQQLTVDDDLASREVRLGYAFYRDAIQYPSGGALVQAIGMNQSNNLYPNIQKFILDRDGIFLLCSDGLSDFDRVEEYWEQEIMPILSGQLDIEDAVKNLLHLANTKNGHDNSTIALLHCQVRPRTTADTIPLDLQTLSQHLTIDPLLPEGDLTNFPFYRPK
ncbi:MAG: protein-serine/threonine phosphatase [Synechococcaceae cyanobacterium RL_1_2]|nr:protein-serine/threonine phosphatase [Synechococcaceae cyanobacterium RL_1_2]